MNVFERQAAHRGPDDKPVNYQELTLKEYVEGVSRGT